MFHFHLNGNNILSLHKADKSNPLVFHGLTGNYYVVCEDKTKLENVCKIINKSFSAIYYSVSYECWSIRVKCRKHKQLIKEYNARLV